MLNASDDIGPIYEFGVAPLYAASVPVAVVGVHSVDQVADPRRIA